MDVRYEYEVKGHGRFPIDMLRYDAAWPVTERDASAVSLSRDEAVTLHGGIDRLATLASHRRPTEARWASFGWRVVRLTTIKHWGTAKQVSQTEFSELRH